nr:PREDICTED: delta(7)-sterol-C5(6)-desaturase 1-like [Bemisia tabaci]
MLGLLLSLSAFYLTARSKSNDLLLSKLFQNIQKSIRNSIVHTLIAAGSIIWIISALQGRATFDSRAIGLMNNVTDLEKQFERRTSWLQQLYLQNIMYFIAAFTFIVLTSWVLGAIYIQKNYYLESTVPGSSGNLLLDKFTTTWNEKVTCAACLVYWSFLVGTVLCYIANRGPLSKVYYGLTDYSLWWLALQFPVLVVYQELDIYWLHRLFHEPGIFMSVHRMHHKVKHQTAWNFLVVHPVEIFLFTLDLIIPAFVVPLHYTTLLASMTILGMLNYIQHLGIRVEFPPALSWVASSGFHILHHKYPKKNLGLQLRLFDKLAGTYLDDTKELLNEN